MEELSVVGEQYPIVMNHRLVVVGTKFIAGIDMRGCKILLESAPDEEEIEEKIWAYGVSPGAVTASGSSMNSALNNFSNCLQLAINDFARESTSFGEFKGKTEEYFKCANDEYAKMWDSAREKVRSGKIDLDGFEKDTSTINCSIKIVLIKEEAANPTQNTSKDFLLAYQEAA